MLRADGSGPVHDAATMAEWEREFRTRLSDIGTLAPHDSFRSWLHRLMRALFHLRGYDLLRPTQQAAGACWPHNVVSELHSLP